MLAILSRGLSVTTSTNMSVHVYVEDNGHMYIEVVASLCIRTGCHADTYVCCAFTCGRGGGRECGLHNLPLQNVVKQLLVFRVHQSTGTLPQVDPDMEE